MVRQHRDRGTRELVLARWGLVPRFSKEIGSRPLINARSETVAERPSFRDSFKKRRCLVAADGFYEWQRTGGKRAKGTPPVRFTCTSGPFAFAGIWDRWYPRDPNRDKADRANRPDPVTSCSILTTKPNQLVRDVHDRMPVMLLPEQWAVWLDETVDPEALLDLLQPLEAQRMESLLVSPRVNSVRYDDPECLLPFQGEPQSEDERPPEPVNLTLF